MRNLMALFLASALCAGVPATSAQAAMFTNGIGPQGPFFGGYACADVRGANPAPGVPVQVWDCHGGGNQQFDLNERAIRGMALQRCWQAAAPTAGADIVSAACTGAVTQQWYYRDGRIQHYTTNLCIDSGNGGNGAQLRLQVCNASPNQRWQIK